ncbi:uncharacterized protein [Asterias amurensis]|uniref:uncharacterized protein n=1 Tax=Asterias amurensis TaxID=7602 RepID=UPI003AB8335E
MSNHSREEGWTTVRRSQKPPHKGAPLLSPESSASSDDGSTIGGRSSSDVYQSGGPQTQILSTQFLQKLAGCIHVKDWKPIFRDLVSPFIKNVDVLIGEIEKDNQNDSREQKYQALVKWKGIRPGDDEAKYEALKATLKKHHCWEDSGQELESVNTGGATKKKPKQKDTGAKPKVPPKLEYEVNDQGVLTIELEGSPEPLLQVKRKGVHTVDKVSVADALLVSIINPSSANLKFKMELTELTDRYRGKYGKMGLSFKDIGVGRVESFVRNKSRSLKLIEDPSLKKCVQEVEADTCEGGEDVQAVHPARNPQFSESESELENWDRYETASERSMYTPTSQWVLAQSPRAKKHGEHPRSSDGELPGLNAFNQEIEEAQLKDLIVKCEGSTIIFRTEVEYMSSKEAGSNLFTKDVVALWNTPRKGPAHIVVGVEAQPSPPHRLVGITQPLFNANYQAKFKESSFSVKPSFFYFEVESSDKVFGVIYVADGGGSEKVCYAKDSCLTGDKWSQNDILFRKGNTTHCATRYDQSSIYRWFLSSPVNTAGAPYCSMSERSEDFEDFMKLLDVENYERRSYLLIVSRCSDETPHLADLADFPWDQVWDFDPDSRESGLLAVCESEDQVRLSLKTWSDPPPHAMSEACSLWLFVRGLRKREDSLVEGNARTWNTRVKKGLDGYFQLLNKGCEKKPLTVVVLWYGNKECIKHLQRTLLNIDNDGIQYLICMPQYPEDKENRGLICEICNHLDIPRVIELPLDRLCCGLHEDPRYGKKQQVLGLQLPGSTQNTSVDKYKAQWLQQHLEVLCKSYDDLTITQDGIKHGESFLKGGTLSWEDKYLGTSDAKRTLSTKLTDYLTKQLTKGVSACVKVYHEPGAGGTTLSRQMLWEFRTRYPCAYAFADAIDPSELCPRLEFLYESTNLPVILLVDGQESRLVKELFQRSSKKIHIIILSVHRYTMEIGNKTQQGERFWLKGEVDSVEAERFRAVFSHLCSVGTQSKLRRMAQDVKDGKRHFVYEFGLTVYHEGYTGLRSYVAGFLELPRDGHLSNWQKAVGYLALAYFYGHQKVPCQFFSDLFGKNRTEIVKADEDLTHSGKQFVIEDKQSCTWRITHYAVAQEILEQILTPDSTPAYDKDDTRRLSSRALRNLKDFAMKFLTYASTTRLHLSIMGILQVMFIHRDYKEVGQAAHKRESLSRLLFDLPSSDQLDIMKHLVKCFPANPTFLSHLGRLHIWKQNFLHAEQHLTKAKDLRLSEIKAKEEKYSQNRGDQKNESESSQDANLCTIYHNFGILYHEEIKQLIGGGKHGSGKQYKCSPDKEGLIQELCNKACSAINNFTNCRQYRKKGMDVSYGFLGEIKVYLHVADFIQTRFKPNGYYGFLESQGKQENMINLLEKCFNKAHSLLGEYQDLITSDPDDKPVTDDFNCCRNWFHAIFDDAETALTYWQGTDSVDGIRSKIAVYKLKHQKGKPLARGSAEAINNITSKEDVDSITELYERMFGDAYKKNIRLDISADLRDWMLVIRNIKRSTVYSLAEKVLHHVTKCCSLSIRSSPTVLYYSFIVNVTLALFTHDKKYFTEANSILNKLRKVRSKMNESYRTFTWEWLGLKVDGCSIDCLVHRSSLGVWNSEKRFWQDERAHAKLQVFTGVITESKMPLLGRICITTDSTEVRHSASPCEGRHSESSLSAVFVPKECGLFGKHYLNTEVEFYIGFNIEHGVQAYNVCELKKYPCHNCNAKGPVSKLNPIKKGCVKCNHPVHVHKDSE